MTLSPYARFLGLTSGMHRNLVPDPGMPKAPSFTSKRHSVGSVYGTVLTLSESISSRLPPGSKISLRYFLPVKTTNDKRDMDKDAESDNLEGAHLLGSSLGPLRKLRGTYQQKRPFEVINMVPQKTRLAHKQT
jgi:hypothetical protein